MLVFADIKSKKYNTLEEIGDFPIIGTIFILLFSTFPSFILLFFDLPKEYETPIFYYISSLWCFILYRLEIYIKLFFIPAWVLFFILGILIGYSNYYG